MNNTLNTKSEFDAFTYTSQVYNKSLKLSFTKREKIVHAVFIACIVPLTVSIDVFTASFRAIKHLNTFSSNKQEGFHLSEFLTKSYEKVIHRIDSVDIKELGYNPAPLTNQLIEIMEKVSDNSPMKKTALKAIVAIAVPFMLILDTLFTPINYYYFADKTLKKTLAKLFVEYTDWNQRYKLFSQEYKFVGSDLICYEKYPLSEMLLNRLAKLPTDSKIVDIFASIITFPAFQIALFLDTISQPFKLSFYVNNNHAELVRLSKEKNYRNKAILIYYIAAISFSIYIFSLPIPNHSTNVR